MHLLLETSYCDQNPEQFLHTQGEIFARFDARTQDSGNLAFGVSVVEQRYFVKCTDPTADVLLSFADRVGLLHNAAALARSCAHGLLPRLQNFIETPTGPMLVYPWVDGELLRLDRQDPRCAHYRFREMPITKILAALSELFDLHRMLALRGWVANDFYDGALIYDFLQQRLWVIDLDNYLTGPATNQMGRMFGSTRFMAPEELELGATIDERTTVFNLARAALIFLGDGTLDATTFRGSDNVYQVLRRACQHAPRNRFTTVDSFVEAWIGAIDVAV